MEEYINTSIETVKTLLICTHENTQAVYTYDYYNHALLLRPQPRLLIKAIYISDSDALDGEIQKAKERLHRFNNSLLAVTYSDNSPREITARLFEFIEKENINVPSLLNSQAYKYIVSRSDFAYVWMSDYKLGRTGYFLTGYSSASNLYQIDRIDIDAFGYPIFTLSLVKPFGDLPILQTNTIKDSLLISPKTSVSTGFSSESYA